MIQQGTEQKSSRCMMTVHDHRKLDGPRMPLLTQASMRRASRRVSYILLWLVFCLSIFTDATISLSQRVYNTSEHGWTWSLIATDVESGYGEEQTPAASLYLGRGGSYPLYVTLQFLLSASIQGFLSLGLHCAELQVQLARFEAVWRTLQSTRGSMENTLYNSVTQPFKTWQSTGLLFFKVIIHWLAGTAVQHSMAFTIICRIPQLTYLIILWTIFVGFMIAVSLQKPRGPLPTTYGHLQTMANVVDELSPKMYWGDKSGDYQILGAIRQAGTSPTPLPSVHTDAWYQ